MILKKKNKVQFKRKRWWRKKKNTTNPTWGSVNKSRGHRLEEGTGTLRGWGRLWAPPKKGTFIVDVHIKNKPGLVENKPSWRRAHLSQMRTSRTSQLPADPSLIWVSPNLIGGAVYPTHSWVQRHVWAQVQPEKLPSWPVDSWAIQTLIVLSAAFWSGLLCCNY